MLVTDIAQIPESEKKRQPLVASGVIGILLFIATEIMFFAALISAYLIIRSGFPEWPPWGQPRLPVTTTAFNTFVLLLSGAVLFGANKAFSKSGASQVTKRLVGISIGLGAFFVLFQGYEWIRLIQFGLTMTSSTYGGVFYLIIGTHGLHVAIALTVLLYTYYRLNTPRNPRITADGFAVAQIFWYFVVGLWPILYVLVYLL